MDWIIHQHWLTFAASALFAAMGLEIWLTDDPHHPAVAVLSAVVPLAFVLMERYAGIAVPRQVIAGFAVFTLATIGLGELRDFYEWAWWDAGAHAFAGFWLAATGATVALALQDDLRPALLAVFAFAVAVAVGGLWELFEYAIDHVFSIATQGVGVDDTMHDLASDTAGGLVGAWAVWRHAMGRRTDPVSTAMEAAMEANPRRFGPIAARSAAEAHSATGSEPRLPPVAGSPHSRAAE